MRISWLPGSSRLRWLPGPLAGSEIMGKLIAKWSGAPLIGALFFLLATGAQGEVGLASKGKQLYERKYSCFACHIIAGKGGKIGPDLTQIGDKRDPVWLTKYLRDPQSVKPGAMMPNLKIGEEDARALAEFLLTLR